MIKAADIGDDIVGADFGNARDVSVFEAHAREPEAAGDFEHVVAPAIPIVIDADGRSGAKVVREHREVAVGAEELGERRRVVAAVSRLADGE